MIPKPLFEPFKRKPLSQHVASMTKKEYGVDLVTYLVFRDNFRTSTWFLLGTCTFFGLSYVIGPKVYILPFGIMFWRLLETLLMTIGLLKNKYMKDVVIGRHSAQLPNDARKFDGTNSASEVCLFLVAARSNHPLGIFGPGFKEAGDYFSSLTIELEANPEENGFLNMSNWLGAGARKTGNEILSVAYFKNAHYLHKFAHGSSHRAAWDWYTKVRKTHPHLSITHETYKVPKGNWETAYVNSQLTGLGASVIKTNVADSEDQAWQSLAMDTSKGK